MDYSQVKDWGFVDSGTTVTDAEGRKYRADNQHGWVVLVPVGDGEPLKFEALDKIDYARFSFSKGP